MMVLTEQAVDPAVRLSAAGTSAQYPVIVALTGGTYVALWQTQTSQQATFHSQMFDMTGAKYGPDIAIHTPGFIDNLRATATDEGFAIAWSNGSNIYSQFFSSVGASLGAAQTVGTITPGSRYMLDMSRSANNGALLSWAAGTGMVAATTSPSGVTAAQHTIVANPFGTANAALAGSQNLLLWGFEEPGTGSGPPSYSVNGQILGSDGALAGSFKLILPTTVVSNTYGHPEQLTATSLSDGRFVVTWVMLGHTFNNSIQYQIFSAAGVAIGTPRTAVPGTTSTAVDSPTIVPAADGGFAIMWETAGSTTNTVSAQNFTSDGVAVGQPLVLQAAGMSGQPAIAALDSGLLAVGWTDSTTDSDVYTQLLNGGYSVYTATQNNQALIGSALDEVFRGFGDGLSLYGRGGSDRFLVDRQNTTIFEQPNDGVDTVISSANFYLYANIENLTLAANAGNIFGVGNELDNLILGNEGTNTLLAGAGADTVRGGAGTDIVYGQDGNDKLFGDAGNDFVAGGSGDDVLEGGAGGDSLYGEDGNDVLTGGGDFVFDQLVGGAGNDVLHGDSGLGDYDYLYGNTGDDTFYVDTPADLVFEQPDEGTDTVYASIIGGGYYLYDNIENLVLAGNTPFGVGNAIANRLTGSPGNNYLLGGGGDDILDGKGGNDVLFGEAGADIFVFGHGTGGDVIGDFVPGTDRIDLSAFGFVSFQQVIDAMHENGGSTAIDLGGGDLVVINGVTRAQFHAVDFILTSTSAKIDAVLDHDPGITSAVALSVGDPWVGG